MTEELTEPRRNSLMSAVEKELIAFERKERELRRQERLERASRKFPKLAKELEREVWQDEAERPLRTGLQHEK
jgi:hypothetical protein